ncbi:MAG: M23 family metallopeptidase [Sphingomonadales bacterium]|nr:M23 family metallopeptidase [Sphingomonadales bacterium]MBD3772750.1 M23 family metallopeptidase [Paracoccaceae bacterium]
MSGGGRGLALADRAATIIVTAGLTSLVWLLVGFGPPTTSSTAPNPEISEPAAPKVEPDASQNERLPGLVPAAPASPNVSGLVIPVAGIKPGELTDSFTDARSGGERVHEAIDIMAPAGTPVIAATGGTIEKMFLSEAGGNTIYLRLPGGGTIHYYAHLQAYAPGLAEGQVVKQGQVLGTVGSSGNASPEAPHLHFAIMQTNPDAHWYDPARAVDPYPLLTAGSR